MKAKRRDVLEKKRTAKKAAMAKRGAKSKYAKKIRLPYSARPNSPFHIPGSGDEKGGAA